MKIVKMKLAEIMQADYNPRVDLKPGDALYEGIRTSIKTFGLVEPLVYNEATKTLVGGHQRLKVLLAEGYKEADVVIVNLSQDKEKALNLILNKAVGAWDQEKLGALFEELQHVYKFDFNATGFEPAEISTILDGFLENAEDDYDFEKTLNEIEKPVTQKGDLIELGCHRMLCGDSSNKDDIGKLLAGNMVDIIVSDPPYLAFYNPDNRPVKGKRKTGSMIQNDNLSQEDYEKLLSSVITNIKPYLSEGAPCYIWNGFRQFAPMIDILLKQGFHISNIITWAKPSIALSFSDYNFQSEFCLYGWLKGNGKHNWYGPKNESNVWQVRRDLPKHLIHQNQKPIELAQRAIKNSSQRGNTVFDGFLGSGSSLIAAQSLNRRCYGIELEPRFVDGIVKRYINYVGKHGVSNEVLGKYTKEVHHDRG